MKNSLLSTIALVLISFTAIAQKKKNQIGLGGEIGFPATKNFSDACSPGVGGWIKVGLGVGKTSDQVTFSSGYTNYKGGDAFDGSISIIPVMIGYKHDLGSGFYIEPQAGCGYYKTKYNSVTELLIGGNQFAFTYALGLGYEVKNVDVGIRFQNTKTDWIRYSNIAIRVGYNFELKRKRTGK